MMTPNQYSELIKSVYRINESKATVLDVLNGRGMLASKLRETVYAQYWCDHDEVKFKANLARLEKFNLHPSTNIQLLGATQNALMQLLTITSGKDRRFPVDGPMFELTNIEDAKDGIYEGGIGVQSKSQDRTLIINGTLPTVPFLTFVILASGCNPVQIYFKHDLEDFWLLSTNTVTFPGLIEFIHEAIAQLYKRHRIDVQKDWDLELAAVISKSEMIFTNEERLADKKSSAIGTDSFSVVVDNYIVTFTQDERNDNDLQYGMYITEHIGEIDFSVKFEALPAEKKEILLNQLNNSLENTYNHYVKLTQTAQTVSH